jgi:protein-S-isoprenylcysteine O-methyltransferase Ste14
MSVLFIRAAALLVPATAALMAVVILRPEKRRVTGAFAAFLWNVTTLIPVNVAAVHCGWWSFHVKGGTLAGVPMDLVLGWSTLWSVIPVLLLARVPWNVTVPALILADLVYMPLLRPLLVLEPQWLLGEILAIAVALVPALAFARWTECDRHVHARNAMWMFVFAGLPLAVIPLTILEVTHESLPRWSPAMFIVLQLLVFPALLGVTAVQEFSIRGDGTPVPYDPPKRLVTSGVYAYVRNPMQLSATLLMLGAAAVLRSWWMLAACGTTLVYSAGLAYWDELRDMQRFEGWQRYRASVPLWLPRWRPHVTQPAFLYIAGGCGLCRSVHRLVERLHPDGVEIIPAEEHPTRDLERITYATRDGSFEAEGVQAVARALEHVNIAFAFCAFMIRLPLISAIVQLVVDAVGGEPRLIRRSVASEAPGGAAIERSCPR